MQHLRFAGLSFAEQAAALEAILRADAIVWPAIERARDLDLPDWMVVSGALYNTVWNNLTGKPAGYGIKDIDLFYHDASDLSWEAEDVVIRRGAAHFAGVPLPVEIRNQARVHLWYKQRFGNESPAFRRQPIRWSILPRRPMPSACGSMVVTGLRSPRRSGSTTSSRSAWCPTATTDNSRTHAEKSARAKALWPELVVEAW